MRIINAITVDVEDYFHVRAFSDVISRSQWDYYPLRVERNTLHLLELFASRQIRATFFVLGWVAQRCPKLVREIASGGHRIGCHSFNHRAIYEGTEREFREDLRRAKGIIEETGGRAVTSFRAPSYSITATSLWALEILAEEGFEYDSSIFPIVHDNYGIRNAPRFPYVRKLQCGSQIKEFPPSTLRILGTNIPVAGGGYFRLYPYKMTAWAVHHLNQHEGQPAMVYLHPWELDPDQPRISGSWLSRFRQYQNLHTTETKCLRLLDDFSWGPMEEAFPKSLHRTISDPLGLGNDV
jgi:polysaccharide deacetylase family protein (PEP-CTERM system associated)